MNFVLDLVDAAPARRLALVALGRDGARSELTFAEVSERSARLAGMSYPQMIAHIADVAYRRIHARP